MTHVYENGPWKIIWTEGHHYAEVFHLEYLDSVDSIDMSGSHVTEFAAHARLWVDENGPVFLRELPYLTNH